MFESLGGKDGEETLLGGDGRCDSPGYCAKYMNYSLCDLKRGYILHVELVDKREADLKSPNMEVIGCHRALNHVTPSIKCS